MKLSEPKLMNLPRMRDILASYDEDMHQQVYIDNNLFIFKGLSELQNIIINQAPPFSFDDRRLGFVISGKARININLVDKDLKAGMLLFIGPGTIVNPISISSDFKLYGFGTPADFSLPCQLPQAFNGHVRDFQINVSAADLATAYKIFSLIWDVAHQENYDFQVVSGLVLTQMYHYDNLYRRLIYKERHSQSREQTFFDRFIQLVNNHSKHEHQISFYADKMCLTERYLGTIIRQASGVTAKEWIDRAILSRIKVELRHTDKTIIQISEEMNFPNPSFFNKYFKRLTGMTPVRFRLSK